MTVMKLLANANGWKLILDLNGCLSLHCGAAIYLVDSPCAALREIPDMETRKLMSAQIYGGH